MKLDMLQHRYYTERLDALTEAVMNSNITPFRKFIPKYFSDKIEVSGLQDFTLQFAARSICMGISVMPMRVKETAERWLENIEIEEDCIDEIAYITEKQKETKF